MKIEGLLNKNIIIFGASKAGENLYKILNDFDCSVKCFVDNNQEKWGQTLFDKTIEGPDILFDINKNNDFIIIGSMYINEISNQLNELKLEGLYIDMYSFIDIIINKYLIYSDTNFVRNKKFANMAENKYLLVLPRGFMIGGGELWTLKVYKLLLNKNRNSFLINLSGFKDENHIITSCENYEVANISTYENNFLDYLKLLVNCFNKLKPFVLITTNTQEIYLAIKYLKRNVDEGIKLVSVLHTDVDFVYIQNKRYEGVIDKFICVSDEIRQKLARLIKHREKDIHTLFAPMEVEKSIRTYTNKDEPIKLGYVGRLVRSHKRADYIIDLIEKLENEGVNYQFSIAGVGEYSSIIEQYIKDKKLVDRVRFLGKIPNEMVNDFWRERDVFINVSDTEGACISMYEGMCNGAVPIVTNVAGAKKFITHGENGFIVNIGGISSMVKYIKKLYNNKNLLKEYGDRSLNKVVKICDPDKFINNLINICEVD